MAIGCLVVDKKDLKSVIYLNDYLNNGILSYL